MAENAAYDVSATRIKAKFNALFHQLYLDADRDYRVAWLLAGSGRSGTTWAAEVLNYDQRYRFLVEPFNNGRVPQCSVFTLRQYLRPGDTDERFLSAARAIFTGRIRNDWTDSLTRIAVYRARMIKDVRCTLMLGWIRRNFPGMPIVFMLRHPCAVANSRVKLRWTTKLRETFCAQPQLMSDYLAPFDYWLTSSCEAFEAHVIDWCVENYVPLMQLQTGDAQVVFYERLCMDPAGELKRLCAQIGRPFDAAMLDFIGRPSASPRISARHQKPPSGEQLAFGWRPNVTAGDFSRAGEIVESFGLSHVYGNGLEPKIDNALESFVKRPTPALNLG
ncbi:MAG: sulfotransferase [Candidatus Eremiobacteraeota bacterium]|nr:sulfotransferase [Candidatus Eremiobacteraeota bacterium]